MLYRDVRASDYPRRRRLLIPNPAETATASSGTVSDLNVNKVGRRAENTDMPSLTSSVWVRTSIWTDPQVTQLRRLKPAMAPAISW
jgi:hypothetical protein